MARPRKTAEESTPSRPGWADLLVGARKRLGFSQQSFAEAVGASQSSVADWELGNTKPRQHLWPKISALTGLPATVFVNDVGLYAHQPAPQTIEDLWKEEEMFGDLFEQISDLFNKYHVPHTERNKVILAYRIWRKAMSGAPERKLTERIKDHLDLYVERLSRRARSVFDEDWETPSQSERKSHLPSTDRLAAHLKSGREALPGNISVAQMATQMGITAADLTDYEMGRERPSPSILAAFIRIMRARGSNLSVEAFLPDLTEREAVLLREMLAAEDHSTAHDRSNKTAHSRRESASGTGVRSGRR